MGFDAVVGVIGLVVGIVGTIVAIYTFYATRIKRELLFLITAEDLISHSASVFPPELTILFNDLSIQSLSKHNILVWNSGNVPIRQNDFIKTNAAIEMTFSDPFRMLKLAIVRESSPINQVSLSVSDDHLSAVCNFLFLEPRDGFNMEVLSAGGVDAHPQIQCNIIGIPRHIQQYKQNTTWRIVGTIL
jgi:hypothetical protein